uniref:Solute carrier family 13 member 2-like n=1 Tax=Phallusia mammillata TaxID=59560 RepID=A0A6F9DSZ7_9ASCI|nr:solute carrier family 13 member 2-like [Phallusia mammillata]
MKCRDTTLIDKTQVLFVSEQNMGLRKALAILWRFRNSLVIVLTPILLLPLLVIGQTSVAKCAYGLCLMAVYWTTEACPLAVTSLLPIILFPMLGIQTADRVSMSYMRQLNFLFVGGLIMAVAIEEWNLHRRIALRVLMLIGSKPCWVLMGFMSVTALLSMWISNTATTAMMIPIAMAVHGQMTNIEEESIKQPQNEEQVSLANQNQNNRSGDKMLESGDEIAAVTIVEGGEKKRDAYRKETNNLRKAMLLCVAYAANIGGFATLIGTPANLILPGTLDSVFGAGASESVDFVSWLGFSLPISLVCLTLTWIWLQIRFTGIRNLWAKSNSENDRRVSAYIKKAYQDLGPVKFGELAVLGHFLVLALLWLTRDPKFIDGWKELFPKALMKDSTSAVIVSFSLFVFPSKNPFRFWRKKNKENSELSEKPGPSPPLLPWKTAQVRLAWDVVLLLGAGFALARACEDSQLTDWVGDKIQGLTSIPPPAFALVISITLSLLTEFTSNVSTASIFLPVLCRLASHANIHPLYIAIPATISCSFAFSLPVATPPNAIAFSYGSLKVKDLISAGLVLNFICIFILNAFLNTTGIAIFNLNSPSSLNATITN